MFPGALRSVVPVVGCLAERRVVTRQRMKLVIAGTILLLGLAGAALFRKETPAEPLTQRAASLPLRALQSSKSAGSTIGATGPVEARIKPLLVDAAAATPAADSAPRQKPATPPATVAELAPPQRPPSDAAAPSAPLEPIVVAASDHDPRPPVSPRVPESAAVPTLHKIRDGDTLPILAERYLGDASRAEEIFQTNRDVLASPDLLPIGRQLRIFTPATGE